ncbi:hypothetical protein FIV42_23305 [Persicimonas caeni]|uniref:Right-handed parallel beta-helix repeat-containing protein n=1 Tax=Persicimonas caeni TaxID=2292766 RepID=A0A4Y6PZ77_PERCE|nr:hypothetical protein [Persicimonas caeni]QDG53563.1 hypothetical protein FIV42_23305 [Persicimonas caeni]QED34784.1 hypothetical protein FRD00_23300 [Persicimonas caeni]
MSQAVSDTFDCGRWGLLTLLLTLPLLSSCSLALDFDECNTSSDCGAEGQCVAGICQELGKPRVEVTDYIVEDTTWTADNDYVLKNLIIVIQPATLTIEPGTRILGERNSALVTQAGAKLVAEGTRENPIVFTSAKPEGQRRSGDWGGLALIGKATLNRPEMTLRILENEDEDKIGGTDDTWDCGTLKYVRSEFGGGLIDGQKALNGITLAACGSETTVDYIQAHLGDDDGIELFGGTVDIRHAVSSRPQGDGFDLDVGWRGTGQFLAVQMDSNGEEAIEIENRGEQPTATPQTDFQIYNYTIIGTEEQTDLQRGLIVKSGGLGYLSHGIVMSPSTGGIHIEGTESGQHGVADKIIVENTLFYNIGADGTSYFSMDELAQQTTFDPQAHFTSPEYNNVFGSDPGFETPYNLGDPDWVPSPEHTTGRDIGPPPDGFDLTAVYRGAFSPSAAPWTEGWTAYPKN